MNPFYCVLVGTGLCIFCHMQIKALAVFKIRLAGKYILAGWLAFSKKCMA